MAQKALIKEAAKKLDDGTMGSFYPFGGSFSDIIDNRAGKGNYSLAQFFDSYLDFLKEVNLVYTGADQPINTHISLWIDSGHTNHDTYGEK